MKKTNDSSPKSKVPESRAAESAEAESVASSKKPLIVFTLLAAFCGVLVSVSNLLSVDLIADNQLLFEQKRLTEISNNPLLEVFKVTPDVYRLSLDEQPAGYIFRQQTQKGYNGNITLWIGVGVDKKILGVRVISHKETPGLGDKIETGVSDWIHTFKGRTLDASQEAGWAVIKDGGDFDQFSGATITPRAVVAAVKTGLERFERDQKVWAAEFDSKTPDQNP